MPQGVTVMIQPPHSKEQLREQAGVISSGWQVVPMTIVERGPVFYLLVFLEALEKF